MLAEQILAYLPKRRPVAILLSGLPGSGKTWLAGLLRLHLDGVHLQTDRIRRELFPVRRYTQEESRAVYCELRRRAGELLLAGRSVILDGTFLVTRERAAAYALFRELGVPFIALLATVSEEVARARFARKPLFPNPEDFSEATIEVYLELKEKLSSDPDYSLPTADRGVPVLVVETERGELSEAGALVGRTRLDGFYEVFSELEAVIFDMDGVIVRSEEAWIQSEREFLEGKGIYLGEEGWRDFQLRHAPYLAGRNQREAARFYQEVFELKESVEEIRRERMAIVRRYFSEVELVPGAAELISALGESGPPTLPLGGGLKIGLASGSPLELIELVLQRYDLERYFSAVISGDEIHEGKPNPTIYLLAAQELKVKPARCLVVEDAPNGVKAAKAAGMRCAYLPNPSLRWEGEMLADFVLDSLERLDLTRLKRALAARRREGTLIENQRT
ncbi:MAG: HAD-IA family hydrolase [Candidatus Bipolaricaulia bacterium]